MIFAKIKQANPKEKEKKKLIFIHYIVDPGRMTGTLSCHSELCLKHCRGTTTGGRTFPFKFTALGRERDQERVCECSLHSVRNYLLSRTLKADLIPTLTGTRATPPIL